MAAPRASHHQDTIARSRRQVILIYVVAGLISVVWRYVGGEFRTVGALAIPFLLYALGGWLQALAEGLALHFAWKISRARSHYYWKWLWVGPGIIQLLRDLTHQKTLTSSGDFARQALPLLFLFEIVLIYVAVSQIISHWAPHRSLRQKRQDLETLKTLPTQPNASAGQISKTIDRVASSVRSRVANAERKAEFSMYWMLAFALLGGLISFGQWALGSIDRIKITNAEKNKIVYLVNQMDPLMSQLKVELARSSPPSGHRRIRWSKSSRNSRNLRS